MYASIPGELERSHLDRHLAVLQTRKVETRRRGFEQFVSYILGLTYLFAPYLEMNQHPLPSPFRRVSPRCQEILQDPRLSVKYLVLSCRCLYSFVKLL